MFAVWMAIFTSFFFGPEWPTIYAHTLDTVTDKRFTETAGAFIVMAIVGGAVVPAIQGYVSDITGSMQFSFIVPTICYVLVTIYFFFEYKYDLKHPQQITES
ncbi:fucose permease [Liquorilactobacillus vini DSM 20605]|uniref:Fucose permease n=3 Tax=Liquorilactobacillus vini TaxID=238015 RepID=A0A0R2BPK0_9LACO|nr:fucose permease [Liquorilactobacillus vini DSM 20605]